MFFRFPESHVRKMALGRRGVTLLEVLVSATVSLVVVAAAFEMFTGMQTLQERTERKLESMSELGVATQRQARMMENAGSNLKSARIAVRVRRDLTSINYWDSASATMMTLPRRQRNPSQDAGVDLRGFIGNSDVIDIMEGYDPLVRRAGRIAAVNSSSGAVTLGDNWAPLNDEGTVRDGGFPTSYTVAMGPPYDWPRYVVAAGRSGGTQTSCLLKVTGIPSTPPPSTTSRTFFAEHATVGVDGSGNQPNLFSLGNVPSFGALAGSVVGDNGTAGATCPVGGMALYGVSRRVVYAVARLRDGDRLALFEFNYDMAADRLVDPVMLSMGVEDLAVNPVVPCGTDICEVADGGAHAVDFPYNGPTNINASSVVALNVRLLSKGLADTKMTESGDGGLWFADGVQPQDGFRRDQREFRISLSNLNPQIIPPD